MLETDEMLSTSQAARSLGVSGERIRQLARSGELAIVTTPLGGLVSEAAVCQLAEQRRQQCSEVRPAA